jgi:hypothetical protein
MKADLLHPARGIYHDCGTFDETIELFLLERFGVERKLRRLLTLMLESSHHTCYGIQDFLTVFVVSCEPEWSLRFVSIFSSNTMN